MLIIWRASAAEAERIRKADRKSPDRERDRERDRVIGSPRGRLERARAAVRSGTQVDRPAPAARIEGGTTARTRRCRAGENPARGWRGVTDASARDVRGRLRF
ncbi:hypothetical protein GCM10023089_24220 [Quisquiliibacterium transsilvanicum]